MVRYAGRCSRWWFSGGRRVGWKCLHLSASAGALRAVRWHRRNRSRAHGTPVINRSANEPPPPAAAAAAVAAPLAVPN